MMEPQQNARRFSSCRLNDRPLHTLPGRSCWDDGLPGVRLDIAHRAGSSPPAGLWNAVSHHTRPRHSKRPGRRKRALLPCTRALLGALIFFLCLLCCEASPKPPPGGSSGADALGISEPQQQHRRSPPPDRRGEPLADPARMGLAPRQDGSSRSRTTTVTVTATRSTTRSRISTTAATVTTTTTDVETPMPTASGASVPRPFDSNLGNNFTEPCLNFFNSFLSNETFQQCVPFSLLLQNSQGFFQAEKSLVRVTQVLDASCGADFDGCTSLMSDLAVQIQGTTTCGPDYEDRNPVVVGAYNGLLSYQTMYQAACLKDSAGGYCFADAVTNATSIAGVYPYYLPLSMALPGGARPACNNCLKKTMQVFANAASNATQPVSQTYPQAADQVNIACGPNFAQANVQVHDGAAAPSHAATTAVVLIAALFAVFFNNLF